MSYVHNTLELKLALSTDSMSSINGGWMHHTKCTNITPAAVHMFAVDEECQKLNKKDIENFHTIVAKLLFVGKMSSTGYHGSHSFPNKKS